MTTVDKIERVKSLSREQLAIVSANETIVKMVNKKIDTVTALLNRLGMEVPEDFKKISTAQDVKVVSQTLSNIKNSLIQIEHNIDVDLDDIRRKMGDSVD